MAGNVTNPNNNLIKRQEIEDLWYTTIGANMAKGKVNITTNEDFKKATLATISKYVEDIKKKVSEIVHPEPIVLNPNQNLHVVSFANAHFFDSSNPQSSLDFADFIEDLLNKGPDDFTACFLLGNLVGTDWKIGNLNNASIDKDMEIHFWGIDKRIEKIVETIKIAIKNGANQIFLMDGREEHDVRQKLNVDILSDIILEHFNDKLMARLLEELSKDSELVDKNVKITYVKGVKKLFNILRRNEDGSLSKYTISMHTNLKTTSNTLAGNIKAAEKQHAGLVPADMKFIQGENVYGTVESSKTVVFTGRASYQRVPKTYTPGAAPDGKGQCTLLLGKKDHDVEKTWSMQFINPYTYPIETKVAELREKEAYLIKVSKQKIKAKHSEFAAYQGQKNFYNRYK